MNSTNVFVTLKKSSPHYWQTRAIISRVTKNRPTGLRPGEVVIELVIQTPDNFFEVPKVVAVVSPMKANLPT